MLTPTQPRDRLDFLDVARGFGAMLVLLEHGLHECFPGYLEFSRHNFVIGQAGILIFFMISGFVIPLSLEKGKSNTTFWIRRVFRLFPVYWLSIGLAFAYLRFGGPLRLAVPLSDPMTWLANLVLLQAPLKYPHVWGVFWSLHYEVTLYIVCSALFACRLLNRIGTKTFVALLVTIALVETARPLFTAKPAGNGDLRMVVLAALFGFLAQRYTAGQVGRRAFYGLLAGLFALVLLGGAVNHFLTPTSEQSQLVRSAVVMGLGYGVFVCLLETRQRHMPQTASWLGRRSYPIYLLHSFVLVLLLPTGWSAWVFMACLVGFTLLFAEATHRLVELPGIALGRRLEHRLKSAPAVTSIPARAA